MTNILSKSGAKIIVIVGPTASGKSALAVSLARRFNGEVISADSRQVYKGLNIGTGKITKSEMRGVTHHLLDVASPQRQYGVAKYVKEARRAIASIARRGHLPIICGGTGLYIDSLLGKINIPDVPPNPTLRKKLEKKSVPELFAILQKLDLIRAETIDRHNPRRLVRAIEIATHAERTRNKRKIDSSPTWESDSQVGALKRGEVMWIGLRLSPEKLKEKIRIRLFSRLPAEASAKAGIRKRLNMIAEAKRLHNPPAGRGLSWKRMESLGLEYRYLSRYLRGLITKEEMIERLGFEIYHYAKRQMQWFNRNKEIRWFDPSEKGWQKSATKSISKFLN